MNTEQKKVMWVEDDEFLSGLISQRLTKEQFEIFTANNGEDALTILKEHTPDIFLLDLMLPGEVDGFKLLETIRANEKTKDKPVLLFSNLASKEDMDKGYGLGATKFLIKSSMVPDEIIAEIKSALGV